ncbi:hypothetical protein [Clostridium formicaceticum]|uniref:Uncharacterized protein n=1 Tax=Clostridium formicaceticum TaxID=1497 RepID=A0AAC9RJR7_9CLOT|nr:hypothetical protein [Clostridium formicaceticum]AOY76891.1 hypothetical protein BJL90_14135 [Clostridium formicaceticum]ARE87371.1 hypothetical protein CLFO_17710 [Clostridium formicaceticum]
MKKIFIKSSIDSERFRQDEFTTGDTPKQGFKLASIDDLINDLCLGGEPILGLIEVKEGVYTWDAIEIPEDSKLGLDVEIEYSYIPL